jgi:dolichyl-phosphate-mannose--protein O-mannosyl transferase
MRVRVGAAALLALELVGCLVIWVALPLGWMWIGAQVYLATYSIALDLGVAMTGFIVTTILTMGMLNRADELWVRLRRQAGHDQKEGVLTKVVVVSAGIGFAAFYIWFHFVEQAFIIQFMPIN